MKKRRDRTRDLRLRDDSPLRSALGQRARKMALEPFTVDVMTAKYEQLWKKASSVERSPRLRVPRPLD